MKGVRSACRAFGRAGLPAVPAVCWKGGLRSVGLPPLLPRRPADGTRGVHVGCLFCSLGLLPALSSAPPCLGGCSFTVLRDCELPSLWCRTRVLTKKVAMALVSGAAIGRALPPRLARGPWQRFPRPTQQASGRQGLHGRDPLRFWVCELDVVVQAMAGVGVGAPPPRGGISCCRLPRAVLERSRPGCLHWPERVGRRRGSLWALLFSKALFPLLSTAFSALPGEGKRQKALCKAGSAGQA